MGFESKYKGYLCLVWIIYYYIQKLANDNYLNESYNKYFELELDYILVFY